MGINQKNNAIKWLAIITITIDLIGYYLFPSLHAFVLLAIMPMLLPLKMEMKPGPQWLGYADYPLHQALLILILIARLL